MLILFIINMAGCLVDMPNTYIPEKATYEIGKEITPEQTLIAQISGVLLENLSIGTSYGGSGIIGTGTPQYHNAPGVQIKTGLQKSFLSGALGFDSEKYYDEPLWLYGVFGGNIGGKILPCIGVNYYHHLDTFLGLEAGLSTLANIAGEWVISKTDATGKYTSVINCGLKLKFQDSVAFELFFKDLSNKQGVGRGIKFSYSASI